MPPRADLQPQLIRPDRLTACLAVVGGHAADLDEDGQLVGYNPDFAHEIAGRLGLALETSEPLFKALIEEVMGHRCDLSVSSQNISASRGELVDFVPYTKSVQPVIVARDNPEAIDDLSDLCGQPVSATAGTTHVDLVTGAGAYVGSGLNADCAARGEPAVDLQTFETESHAVTALLAGDVVAYLGNPSFVFDFPDQIEYSPATLPPARQGITTAKDRPLVHAAVQVAFNEMMADGTYEAILREHLPNEASVDAVNIID